EYLLAGDFAGAAQTLRRAQQVMPGAHVLTVVDPEFTVVARANSEQRGEPLRVNGLVARALQGQILASPEVIPEAEWAPEGERIRQMVVMPVIPGADSQ